MHIFKDINIFFNILNETPGFYAHSDSYPYYKTTLSCQFNMNLYPELYDTLSKTYDLEIDYFQSGTLLFKSSLITDKTKSDLLELANTYYISKTNEQGIMNLYFNCINNIWKPLPIKYENILLYDFWERYNYNKKDYTMLKYPQT
jgi:hypothetical protein